MSVSGWVGDRWYVIQWAPKTKTWDAVWVRRSRDKPKISKWLKAGDRDTRPASFSRIEHAEEYVRLITSGDHQGRFEIYDA